MRTRKSAVNLCSCGFLTSNLKNILVAYCDVLEPLGWKMKNNKKAWNLRYIKQKRGVRQDIAFFTGLRIKRAT